MATKSHKKSQEINRRSFLRIAALGVGACAVSSCASLGFSKKQPNIVLIMADDLGFECIGAYGCTEYKTPVLDKLAKKGIRFDHCYSQPLCTPSRVQIMTGRYNHRNYTGFGMLDKKEVTFGNLLRDSGYSTCIAGKWQLEGDTSTPDHFGFDEYCLWFLYPVTGKPGGRPQGRRYWKENRFIENGKPMRVDEDAYGPDLFCNYITNFIGRQSDKPFFVYYPMVLTHAPFDPTPDSPAGASREWSQKNYRDDKYMKDMVEYMDKIVGRIVTMLERKGILEDTIIMFTGDNGTDKAVTTDTKTGPIKGYKGLMTDGGTRVPLIVNYPRGSRSRVNDDLIDFTDFLPTCVDAAGGKLPTYPEIDGVSFYPQLCGKEGVKREWVFCHYWGGGRKKEGSTEWIRDRRWKLYNNGDLFDVKNDVLELKPLKKNVLSGDSQAAYDRLAGHYKKFRELPIPNDRVSK